MGDPRAIDVVSREHLRQEHPDEPVIRRLLDHMDAADDFASMLEARACYLPLLVSLLERARLALDGSEEAARLRTEIWDLLSELADKGLLSRRERR